MGSIDKIFKKLTLDNVLSVRQYLNGDAERTCDFTTGGVFIWRDYFDTHYTIFNDTLILMNSYNGKTTFSVPQGKGALDALHFIDSCCKTSGIATVFNTVTKTDLSLLESVFSVVIQEERALFDYLYSAKSLASFTGRRYNGQRNHINSFMSTYPDFVTIKIDPENIWQLSEFMEYYEKSSDINSPIFKEEIAKVYDVLSHNDRYSQDGVFIKADGRIVAFAMGEVVADTLYVHIEKALAQVRGAYQMIVREFVRHSLQEHEFVYVNREDDVGDEGLRRSKLSYHPERIIEKFTVFVQ